MSAIDDITTLNETTENSRERIKDVRRPQTLLTRSFWQLMRGVAVINDQSALHLPASICHVSAAASDWYPARRLPP